MRFATTMLTALCLAAPAFAQNTPGHAGMAMGGNPMMESMKKMNDAMNAAPMTGNPDHDFVAMMIPHHQGAIDMAQYELAHGKDPAIRKLAGQIMADQKKEIALMNRWLAKHPN